MYAILTRLFWLQKNLRISQFTGMYRNEFSVPNAIKWSITTHWTRVLLFKGWNKLSSFQWLLYDRFQWWLQKDTPTCDIFGNPYICSDKFWSKSSTVKFRIPWKSQEKMLPIDIGHTYGGCVKIEKKQAKLLADLEANG